MLILICDNVIAGQTNNSESVPNGYTVIDYPGSTDIRQLYYDPSDAKVKPIPPRPPAQEGSVTTWNGTQWVSVPRGDMKISPKEQYIGSAIYKWAKSKALSDNKIFLIHITAMCADAGDVREELKDCIKELRELRNAEQNSVKA